MTFSDTQVRQLRAKLHPRHIRIRKANGLDLRYVEGWHAIAEANRIFGHDGWDRRTIAMNCVWSGRNGNQQTAAYTAKVRITVRARNIRIVREGSGTGEGKGETPGQAHELALKAAETDATKRALVTFGNPFGLALYDREHGGVKKLSPTQEKTQRGPWALRSANGTVLEGFDHPNSFVGALRKAMSDSHDVEMLYDIWEHNIEALRDIDGIDGKRVVISALIAHLRACALELVKPANGRIRNRPSGRKGTGRKIDKSVLGIGEQKRIRCKEHLRFVAEQACLVCGRSPAHAHHIRYAQPRGLSLKVSDEFTVPLCATHHQQMHTTLKEFEWWQERNIDPLKVASELWSCTPTRRAAPTDEPDIAGKRTDTA